MKNLKKHIFTSSVLYFRVGSICAKKDKSLPQLNEEYADKSELMKPT
jgi:hypothetical protein